MKTDYKIKWDNVVKDWIMGIKKRIMGIKSQYIVKIGAFFQ